MSSSACICSQRPYTITTALINQMRKIDFIYKYSETCLYDHLRNRTTWELRAATPVPRPIQYIEIDLRNKTTSEFRTVFHSPLGVPNSQVPLYVIHVVG